MSIIFIKNFKRYEKKYFVTEQQFNVLKKELEKHMALDKYCEKTGSYMIYNLYFDTQNDDIISKSIQKPYYKEKLRLRSYKTPIKDTDTVFLELKKKIGGIVAKRRAVLTYAEAMNFVETGTPPICDNYNDNQVLEEIKEFLSRYPAKPKVFISYQRIAYFDKNDSSFRVSFDRKILTRRNDISFKESDYGNELIEDKKYLMEIKLSKAIPMWMSKILSENQIFPTSFSKYGTEYQNYVLRRLNIKHTKSSEKTFTDSFFDKSLSLLTNKGVNLNAR